MLIQTSNKKYLEVGRTKNVYITVEAKGSKYMTEEEIAEIWKKMVKEEKDKHRKMLHGSSKSITAENKFRLLKNNGKRCTK